MKKIIVVFKTHLDIGFTDFAEEVTKKYMESYLPAAMRVAREMRGEKDRFIWTTGSWLIERYLEEGEQKEMLEDAIRHGEIRWHGLPFTPHTELMTPELFEYGLNISQKMDQRFGMHTIAAKLTDVPGHTKAMIEPMCKAGIKFLHIGVNPASTPPEVPGLFKWRDDEGNEIVVMYHKDYGEMSQIGDSGVYVCFAHTGDNRGPQSAEQIRELFRKLHEKYPEAEIQAGTLEDIAEVAITQELPVVTEEIGDSWIHGPGSDPGKISQYRALLRLKDKLSEKDMETLYKGLVMVPEHTWGLDEKTHLGTITDDVYGEYDYFEKESFKKARSMEKFQAMERSWDEQRKYMRDAVENLSGSARELAESALKEYKRDATDTTGWEQKQTEESFEIGGVQVKVSSDGKLVLPEASVGFLYEVFSQKEYDRFTSQYVTSDESWAREDFGKIGVDKAIEHYESYRPSVSNVWTKDAQLVIRMKLPEEAVVRFGGMESLEMYVKADGGKVKFDFAWFGKEASRIPEAAWITVDTEDKIQTIKKMGKDIKPDHIVSGGNRKLHAATEVKMEHSLFKTEDSMFINIGEPGMLDFADEIPELNHGFCLNLFNNIWGTNFTMWYGEDARFRFELDLK